MRIKTLFSAIVLCGCATRLAAPPSVNHRAAAFGEVPYPPPAALSETVPERPDTTVVWLDGEWMFRGSSYVWRRGGWVVAPQSGRFATWQLRYTSDGRLLLASGTWYDAQKHPIPHVEPKAPAATPPNEMTRETQVGR